MAFTFFFRDRHTLNHLANLLAEKIKETSHLRIWDAGCAKGQEPYTLSIILAEILSETDFNKIKKALKHFKDWDERWKDVEDAGEVYKIENNEDIYIQINGIELEDAKEIIKLSTTRSAIPEPVRVAHLIASGVVTGESKGNA